MFNSEDDWIRATTDPLDFCPECRMHVTRCECPDLSDYGACMVEDVVLSDTDVDPCLYCGKAFATFHHNPYCSPECSARAEGESIE